MINLNLSEYVIGETLTGVHEEELQGKIGFWFGKVENPADIEKELTKISSTIITSFERACPDKRIRRKNRVPWWNRELKTLRKFQFPFQC